MVRGNLLPMAHIAIRAGCLPEHTLMTRNFPEGVDLPVSGQSGRTGHKHGVAGTGEGSVTNQYCLSNIYVV